MRDELADLVEALDDVPELSALLVNPEIDSRVKADVLERVLGGADELIRNFVRLLAEKGRAGEIREIAAEFEALVAVEQNVLDVELTTAHELSDAEAEGIVQKIAKASGRDVNATAVGRPGPDRGARPPGRIDEARRQCARPARTTTPTVRNDKELAE